jgi:MFS transporter, ACDE family, multidrug resistance protein
MSSFRIGHSSKVEESTGQTGLVAIFAIGGICMFVVFGTLFYLSDVLEEQFHIEGVIKGCVLAIPLAALCLASFLTGKWIGQNKKRMKWITFIGIAILSACVLLCGMVLQIYMLIILLSLAGIGIGSALPCLDAMITEGIEKEERGTISSLYSSMRFIGVAAGPPAASLLIKISPRVMFYSISAVCMVAAILALFAIRPKQEDASSV